MGTRNLVAVKFEGEYRIAQYGQWDGYPSGQGITVLKFLRSQMREQFLTNLLGCRWGTDEEIKATWKECGADDSGWAGVDVSKRHTDRYPELGRDTGAGILKLVQERPCMLQNSISFASESLFCEWAYVIDFDAMTLEVFKGFNHAPLPPGERFSDAPIDPDNARRGVDSQYYPVKLVKAYDLNQPLPTPHAFVKELNELTRDPEDEE